jgi:hypothetical protein
VITHWFWWLTGSRDETGRAYGFWSGFGGSIPDFLILGSIVAVVRHRNCHVTGCKKIRTHLVPGTPYRACPKHHPAMTEGDVTEADIAHAHREANS